MDKINNILTHALRCKDGGTQWRTLTYQPLNLFLTFLFSVFLMVMEVKITHISIGKEVAAFVERHFLEELKKNKNF